MKKELYNLAMGRFIMGFSVSDNRASILTNSGTMMDVSNYTPEELDSLKGSKHTDPLQFFSTVDPHTPDGITFMGRWAIDEPQYEITLESLIQQRPQVLADVINTLNAERDQIHLSILKEINHDAPKTIHNPKN